jgi:hypothetical protein
MVCMGFQKYYGGLIFTDDFFEEITDRQLQVFYIP